MAMLADQDDYLALTGTPSPADETLCNQITASLTAASAAAERYCGRSFASTTQTEYYDGNGYPELPLDHWPITAVASVYLDINGAYGQASGAFPSNTLLTVGTHSVWIGAKGGLGMKFFPGFWPPYGGPGGSPWGYPNLTRHGAAANGWPRAP